MKAFDAFLARIAFILLVFWAFWFSRELGIKPRELGQAVKNFNASFGGKLPDVNRK